MTKLDAYLDKIKIFEEKEKSGSGKLERIKQQENDLENNKEKNNTIGTVLEQLKQALPHSYDKEDTYSVNEMVAQYGSKLSETNIQIEDQTELNDKILLHKSLNVKLEELENNRTELSTQERGILTEQADHRKQKEFGEAYYKRLDQIKGDISEFEQKKAAIISDAHEEQIRSVIDLKIKKTNIYDRFQGLVDSIKNELGERVAGVWNPEILADVPTQPTYFVDTDDMYQHSNEQMNQLEEFVNLMDVNKEIVSDKDAVSSRWWSDIKKVGYPLLIIGGALALLGIAFGAFWIVLTGLVYLLTFTLYLAPLIVVVMLFSRDIKVALVTGIIVACISWFLAGFTDDWADQTWYKAEEAFLTIGSVFTSPMFWIALAIIILLTVSWFVLLKVKSQRLYNQANKMCHEKFEAVCQDQMFLRALRVDYDQRERTNDVVKQIVQYYYEQEPKLDPAQKMTWEEIEQITLNDQIGALLIRYSAAILLDATFIIVQKKQFKPEIDKLNGEITALKNEVNRLVEEIRTINISIDKGIGQQLKVKAKLSHETQSAIVFGIKRKIIDLIGRLEEVRSLLELEYKAYERDRDKIDSQLKLEKALILTELEKLFDLEVNPFKNEGQMPNKLVLGLKKGRTSEIPRRMDDFWLIDVPKERPIIFVYDKKELNDLLFEIPNGAQKAIECLIRRIADSFTQSIPAYLMDQTLIVPEKSEDYHKYESYNKNIIYSYKIDNREENVKFNEEFIFNYEKKYTLSNDNKKWSSEASFNSNKDVWKLRKALQETARKRSIVYAVWDKAKDDKIFNDLETAGTEHESVALYTFMDVSLYETLEEENKLQNFSNSVYRIDISDYKEIDFIKGRETSITVHIDPEHNIIKHNDGNADSNNRIEPQFSKLFKQIEVGSSLKVGTLR